jgi:hypothetical protein
MKLCGGTLEIDDGDVDELLLAYISGGDIYAYPAYDTLVTNSSTELVTGDLLAPTLLDAHVDFPRFTVLRRLIPVLNERIAALPSTPLEATDDAGVATVARLFGVLDGGGSPVTGVRGSIVSKVLHRKRPDLIPLYDSRIWTAYTVAGAIPRTTHRTWEEFMAQLCAVMRTDLQDEAARFTELQGLAAKEGAELSPLRILDILVWMSSEPPS